MLDSDNPWVSFLYYIMAALAGAVTALSFMKWREMHVAEVIMTVVVGFSFAVFATPWLARVALGTTEPQTVAFLAYVSASGSNILLPMAIRWLGRAFGQEKSDA